LQRGGFCAEALYLLALWVSIGVLGLAIVYGGISNGVEAGLAMDFDHASRYCITIR
jgi:hypothetical protein